jgi:hypothetical protein
LRAYWPGTSPAAGFLPWRLVRLRALWLLWVAVAIQVAQYYVDPARLLIEERLGVPMLALVFATVAAWLAANLRGSAPLVRAGMVVILLGALSNGGPLRPTAGCRTH